MKPVAIRPAVAISPAIVLGLTVGLGLASGGARAQDTGGTIERFHACSLLAPAERLDCLDRLAGDVSRAARLAAVPSAVPRAPAVPDWVVSETTSPLDYSPVAIATASYDGGVDAAALKLSVECRGGRTDMVMSGPALTRRGDEYIVSYRVDDGQPAMVATGSPVSGAGVAVRGDSVSLMAALPDRGVIAFRVADRQGAVLEGRYALAGLKTMLKRMAGPCKWPAAATAPHN